MIKTKENWLDACTFCATTKSREVNMRDQGFEVAGGRAQKMCLACPTYRLRLKPLTAFLWGVPVEGNWWRSIAA